MKRALLIMLGILLSLNYVTAEDNGNDLTVTVEGIIINDGQISIGVYNSPDNYGDTEKVFVGSYVKAKKGSVTYTFKDLPKGVYAISLYHDENMNSILDRGLFKIPKEGYAFSNNVFGSFGSPKFKEASFVLDSNKSMNITIKY